MSFKKVTDRDSQGKLKVYSTTTEAGLLTVPRVFTYVSDGDINGLFYYLGQLATGTWTNPHLSGQITVTASSSNFNTVDVLVNRQGNQVWFTNNVVNSYVVLDVGTVRTFVLNNILLRHDNQSTYFLRNFKIRGSNNVVTNTITAINDALWVDLATFVNNTTINAANGWGNFIMSVKTDKYRHFQILQTGLSSNNDNRFDLGEIELYGTLY